MRHGLPDDDADACGDAASSMVAGRSAREVAQGADDAARTLERKAAYARRRAANFRQGAAGEQSTADALAELSREGWVVLHDRLLPTGGNIDHLLIGPGGVVVVDSKSWSGAVAVNHAELRVGGRNRSAEVARVATSAGVVRQGLADADLHPPVHTVVSLTQEAPPHGPVRLSAGPLVAGVADVAWTIGALPTVVRPSQVDAIVARALQAFPAADRTLGEAIEVSSPERKPAGELFSRGNIFLYVEPWARSGHQRLYLNDSEGRTLGYKDLVSGEITISMSNEGKLVRGVLANAHSGGLSLSRSALPKIPVRLPGGRLLGHLGRLWSNFLIGHHWRRGGKDRLYVTHAVIDQGIFDLGYIDLASGLLFPSSDEPLAKDLREPRRYLERVAERYPRR
ncbi:MAG TPA: nuclease-related domain-containing protein [Nocardioidaceae bacterium]